jgi:tol-pal system protein YbgF
MGSILLSAPLFRTRTPRSVPRRRPSVLAVAAGWVGLAVLVASQGGCANGKDAADRQIDRMRADIMRLESDQDKLSTRLTAIEMNGKGAGGTATAAAPRGPEMSPATGDRPALRVVVLKPGEELPPSTEVATTDEGHASQRLTSADARDRDRDRDSFDEEGSAKPGKGSKRGRPSPKAASKEYDEAYALVKSKEYDRAITAMTGFLVRYPDHPDADAAMFWIGASHAAKGETTQAIEILEGVLARFPDGNKAPDALLELSRAYKKQGDDARAAQAVARLHKEFPRSDAAQRAPKS